MKTYDVVRDDLYKLTVEANSLAEAREIVENNDEYLNDGEYCGSEFEFEDEEVKEDFSPQIVLAEDQEDFQDYLYEDGSRIPSGTPIGVEVYEKGKWRIKLLRGINYG